MGGRIPLPLPITPHPIDMEMELNSAGRGVNFLENKFFCSAANIFENSDKAGIWWEFFNTVNLRTEK